MALQSNPQFGPFFGTKGADLSDASVQITSPIHHVTTTGTITTLTPPVGNGVGGFTGPVFLVADSVFFWSTSGNIGTIQATTTQVGYAYSFIYSKADGKWYPVGAGSI